MYIVYLFGLILQSNRLANTVRRYIRIHDFYHIKTYMFKQNHSSSGRPMNAPTVWFVQTIKMLRSGIKVFDLKNYLHEWGAEALGYKVTLI